VRRAKDNSWEAPFMARDEKKYLVEECYRLAEQARRLASIPGLRPEEKADLIEVEQRWLSIARTRQAGSSDAQ
jgi:hypothetical protein